MRKTFQEATIEEICNVEYGTRVVRKKDAGTIYPVYGGGGETFFLDTYNREHRVVVARFAMSEKCTRRVTGKFALNDSGLTLSPKDSSILRQDYLDYFVLSINNQIYECARGTAQKNLDVPAFKRMKVVYPTSLEKQHEIVKKLDGAFRELASLEHHLELGEGIAVQLLKSSLSSSFSLSPLHQGFSLKLVQLKDVCLEVPRIDPKALGRQTFKYLDIGSLSSDSRSIGEVNIVSVSDAPGRARQLLSKNDSVFSTVRPYMKKIAFIDQSLDNEIASTGFCVLRPDSKMIEPRFLYHYLYSDLLLDQVLPLQTGVSYPAIRNSDLKRASIALPTLERQREIINKLDKTLLEIESLRAKLEMKRNAVAALRQSLLRSAFMQDEVLG